MDKKPFIIQLLGLCTGITLEQFNTMLSIVALLLTILYTTVKLYQALKGKEK